MHVSARHSYVLTGIPTSVLDICRIWNQRTGREQTRGRVGSVGMQAAALGPAIAGAGRLGAGAPFRGPALAPGLLPARAARAPSAYLTGVTPALSGVAMGDGAFPATASVGSGRQAQLGTPAVTAAAVGVQPGIAAGRSSSAGLVAPTIGGVTDVARPTAIVGSAASVGPPSTPAAVVGTDIPTAPVAASVSATSSQFGTVPGTNIPVVPSTASADLVPAMQTAGSGTLTGTTSVPVDQDGLVSYGAPAGAPVVLPPSPPPRLRFGADSSRITGAGSDDPANSAGNNNVFGIDRSRAGATSPSTAALFHFQAVNFHHLAVMQAPGHQGVPRSWALQDAPLFVCSLLLLKAVLDV